MARAFYEEYQIKITVIGKYKVGPNYNSRIVNYMVNEKIDQEEVFVETINQYARAKQDKKIFLLGAGDNYVNMITKNEARLPENIIIPYINHELMDHLQRKDNFYRLCDQVEIDYPNTVVVTKEMGLNFMIDFPYPVILKSCESVRYWDYAFEGQEKTYTINHRKELDEVITKIRNAGYVENLIIQERIPGNDEYMYDLSAYADQSGEVIMMTVARVLLEEHTPTGCGNAAVNITEYNEELMTQAKRLLESVNYVGFASFDIKYDYRDGKYKFFEINTRMGRSHYYVTAYGFNVARYLVKDYIYQQKMELQVSKTPRLWTVIPKRVAFKYVQQPENLELMKKLYDEGKVSNSVFFKKDLPLRRLLHLIRTHLSHFRKYNKFYKY